MLMAAGCVVWAFYKITYSSISATESLSLLAFNFTVLVAVPALRGVLLPSNLQFAPLFDFFVVLIWTVGLLALVVNVIRRDVMVPTEQFSSADRQGDSMLFVGQRRERVDGLKDSMPRRAAS